MNHSARFVVLTEDGGASGWKPVEILVRAICDQLVRGIRWSKVEVLPRQDAGGTVLKAIAANRWKGADGTSHSLRVQLARYIADKLLVSDGAPRFVFFHVDADRTWSQGGPSGCENATKFEALVRTPVRTHLAFALQRRERIGELDALMARLHLVVPCYSIEAWLYQSVEVARARCLSRTCRGAHGATFDEWARDRTALDELSQPKDASDDRGVRLHCLKDADKEVLANAFPAGTVRAVGRSFSAAVDAVGDDGALLNALVATGS